MLVSDLFHQLGTRISKCKINAMFDSLFHNCYGLLNNVGSYIDWILDKKIDKYLC